MSKILLVNSWQHPRLSLNPRITAIEKCIPLNLVYVASSLLKEGHEVNIIDPSLFCSDASISKDENAFKKREMAIIRRLVSQAKKSEVVGFATSAYDWIPNQKLMNAVAKVNPRIFVGGWGCECYPKDYLTKTPAVVKVGGLHGEALLTLPQLIPHIVNFDIIQIELKGRYGERVFVGELSEKTLRKLKGIRGLSYLKKSKIVETKRRLPPKLPEIHPFISDFGISYADYRNVFGHLTLPVLGSALGCAYSFQASGCIYCAQHTHINNLRKCAGADFLRQFKKITMFFDKRRVISDIKNCTDAAQASGEEIDNIFFVDDSISVKSFMSVWEYLKDVRQNVIFSTRPDYLTDGWINTLSKVSKRIKLNIGVEFFSLGDVKYMRRSPQPDHYVSSNQQLIKKLLAKKITFKVFVFLKGLPIWHNMAENILGTLDLIEAGAMVNICPTVLADFTDIPATDCVVLKTDHYMGLEIPSFISYAGASKKELEKIENGLQAFIMDNNDHLFELKDACGLDLLQGLDILKSMVSEELEDLG